MSEGIQREQR